MLRKLMLLNLVVTFSSTQILTKNNYSGLKETYLDALKKCKTNDIHTSDCIDQLYNKSMTTIKNPYLGKDFADLKIVLNKLQDKFRERRVKLDQLDQLCESELLEYFLKRDYQGFKFCLQFDHIQEAIKSNQSHRRLKAFVQGAKEGLVIGSIVVVPVYLVAKWYRK